jgi:hypothetical protein
LPGHGFGKWGNMKGYIVGAEDSFELMAAIVPQILAYVEP